MASRGMRNRFLQLVQQRLLAFGREGTCAAPCMEQQLTSLRQPAVVPTSRLLTTSSLTSSTRWAAHQRQLSTGGSRGFATASAAGRPRGPVSYASLALTAATGAGLIVFYNHLMSNKLQQVAAPQEASAGVARIGGPFELVDQHGKPFSDKNLLGEWALLYFGFTFCPDICPDELDKMTEVVNSLEKESGVQIQPVFISVDPERDSVKQVDEYVKEFHPRLIGLTGPADKVNAAAKAYRVYHTKTDDTSDYLVDHSIIMYLVNPKGDFVTFFGKNFDAPAMTKAIQGHVKDYSPSDQA